MSDFLVRLFQRRPWIPVLFLAAVATFFAVKVAGVERRLPPHGVEVAYVLVGTLSLLGLLSGQALLGKRVRGHSGTVTAILVGLLVVCGAHYGIGVTYRSQLSTGPATYPESLQSLGAGVCIGLVLVLAVFSVRLGVRVISTGGLSPAETRKEAAPHSNTKHDLAVYDVRPDPDDLKNQFDPHFIALCSCGWVGLGKDTSSAAFVDARTHKPDVDPEIRTPGELTPSHR